jgi:alkanesulfonate monooxygenase SsuD/methylene tetrahydromethanopterin reductase-like flavin-dependent oxidoreductase (luciferase family)
MGLGTAIIILPLEDPLRLAEDAAAVDTLSGGRPRHTCTKALVSTVA